MTKNRSTMLFAGFAVLFAGATPKQVIAQTEPAPTSPAVASSAKNEEAIQLEQFNVSAEKTTGYTSSETMSASRVNTKIIDLPYSVVSLDGQFFKDFDIRILDQTMTYLGGFTGLSIGGGFNIRGFSATSQLRDGFYRLGRYDSASIGRIEIIRGSNAGVYGRTSPGGMINMISKQPLQDDSQTLLLSRGGYGQSTEELDLDGSIDKAKKTYYVMTLSQDQRYYPGMFGTYRNNDAFLSIKHDFSESSHLLVYGEYFINYNAGTSQASPPALSVPRVATPDNAATATVLPQYDVALGAFSPYGPDASVNRGSDTFVVEYDKEFNSVFSFRQGIQKFSARAWSWNNAGWASPMLLPATGPITNARSAVPTFGRIMEDGGGTQSDFIAHYPLFDKVVDAKTLLTIDYNDYYRWDPTLNYSVATNPNIVAYGPARTVTMVPVSEPGDRIGYIPTPGVPVGYFAFPVSSMWSQGPTLNALTRRRTSQLGGNINQQLYLFDNRLILYGGLRVDNVRFSQRDYTVPFASVGFPSFPAGTGGAGQPNGSVVRRFFHQRRPEVGFNYAIDKAGTFHLYGSYSESYFVDQTNRPQAIASPGFKPNYAKGYDYGIKGDFLNDRLVFTLGGYYANQYNVTDNDQVILPNGTIQTQTNSDGDQNSKGAELDLTWLPTDELNIQVSAATVNAKYVYFGTQYTEAVGRSVQNMSPVNGSIIAKYAWNHGPLKGFDAEGLVTYVAATPSESPTAGDTAGLVNGKSVVTAHTDQWKLRTPSYTLWQFAFHYQLPTVDGVWYQSLGLNINNAFNHRYFLDASSKTLGDQENFVVSYTIAHGAPPSQ